MAFGEIDPRHQIMTTHQILEGVCAKNLGGNNVIRLLPRPFTPYREKMEQILLAYSLPKESVAASMMLYKKTNKTRK